jgi:hypothetical protein
MKALISSTEIIHKYDGTLLGHRVAQVEPDESIFGVADSLMWVDCAEDVVADRWYFDPNDSQIKEVPLKPQPETTGTQSL